MVRDKWKERKGNVSSPGYTLPEVIAVVGVIMILTAIGVPSYLTWRQGALCRASARDMVSYLRAAQGKAIAMNRECRIEFEEANRRYGLRLGDRAQNTSWQDVPPVLAWEPYPPEVDITSNISSIQFNTNGTANGGTITVRDNVRSKKYDIIVNRTGRVRVK